jgi:hypothetical protein
MSNTEPSGLDRALFVAAALRGYRLHRMAGDYYGACHAGFKRYGDVLCAHCIDQKLKRSCLEN